MTIDEKIITGKLTVDDYGVVRNSTGEKIAIFKSKEMALFAVERMELMTAEGASIVVKSGHHNLSMERVFYWRLLCV